MLKIVTALSLAAGASALKFGTATSMQDVNPPPYEVYNVAIENASPDAVAARRMAEERRAEAGAMAAISESRSSFMQGGNAQDFPAVEVSLASAVNPYPTVAASIAAAEQTREQTEKGKLAALTTAYASILASAKTQIVKVISGHPSSFMKMNPIEPSVYFNMVQSHSDVTSAGAAIDAMESKRQTAEMQMLDSAISELSEFAKVIVSEIERGLKSKGSFLEAVPSTAEGFHRQLNIKISPSDSFQTVNKMAESMERRRDVSEAAMRATILDLELAMAKSLNAFTAATLHAH